MKKSFELYDRFSKMSPDEVEEVLFPISKPLSVEEGFEVYKSFFNKQ